MKMCPICEINAYTSLKFDTIVQVLIDVALRSNNDIIHNTSIFKGDIRWRCYQNYN